MYKTDHPTDAEIMLFCISRRSLGQKQLEVLDHLRECEICNRKYWESFQASRIPLEIELDEDCTLVLNKDENGRCTMSIHESENKHP